MARPMTDGPSHDRRPMTDGPMVESTYVRRGPACDDALAATGSTAREGRQDVDARADRLGRVAGHDPVHEERTRLQHPGHRVAVALDEQRLERADSRRVEGLLERARRLR